MYCLIVFPFFLKYLTNTEYMRPLPNNTKQSQQTDIHAPGGIRTHNPSNRAASDPRLNSAAIGNGFINFTDSKTPDDG